MSSTSGAHRAPKRQRAGQHEVSDSDNVRSAITALLERLIAVRSNSETVRDEHLTTIANIDERIAAKQTALRAVARVVPPPPSEDIAAFSRGVPATTAPVQQPDVTRPPLPAMKLLVEQDPPEKLIHEQSIIVRAQAINRKNAELARERLPKQPEAQRNKTHWDYLMDEAVWLAADFREERKWKMRLAKSLAKAAASYHVQKKQREARAIKEEHTRMRRLAASVARDVKKFWSQIKELHKLRNRELEDIRLKAERQEQLDSCLRQAVEITSTVAVSLQNAAKPPNVPDGTTGIAEEAPPSAVPDSKPDAPEIGAEDAKTTEMDKCEDHTLAGPSLASGNIDSASEVLASQKETPEEPEAEFTEEIFHEADVEDDERTMAVAEAEEEKDPKETMRLETEANMSIEELLASQGIDLASYAADKRKYLSDEEDSAEEDTESSERSIASSGESDEEANGNPVSGQSFSPLEPTIPAGSRAIATDKAIPDVKQLAAAPQPDVSVLPSSHASNSVAENLPASSTQETMAASLASTGSSSSKPSGDSNVPKELVMNGDKGPAKTPPGASRISIPTGLLRGTLRDYQYAGMQWLITLYKNNVNGILADEMGLGKTIQTIALLAWLAIEKGIWGPHLIVVPTSVMVNWEVEFKKWLPGFKILTYFGSLKERKAKRVGWSRPNTFHVCITSYALVVQDASALRRKEWMYLILDEAHNIKNFQSQRWQTLLRFPSQRRLLLTGTPLQNSVMELWSLMHFLMPNMFQSQAQFKDWFAKPLGSIVTDEATTNARESVDKLHEILRPFLLRRLKRDVEKSLPPKEEHVQKCPLSKRQRQLYEDFLSRSDTQNTLQSGDFFGVMGVLMQLRKVCNHPDLFEGRPILSPFAMKPVFYPLPALVMGMKSQSARTRLDLSLLSLDLATDELNGWSGDWHSKEIHRLSAVPMIVDKLSKVQDQAVTPGRGRAKRAAEASVEAARRIAAFRKAVLRHQAQLTSLKVRRRALLGEDKIAVASMTPSSLLANKRSASWDNSFSSNVCLTKSLETVVQGASGIFERFVCCIRKVTAPAVELRFAGDDTYQWKQRALGRDLATVASPLRTLFRTAEVRSSVTLPDARLVQWDCGKLQVLSVLLRKLKKNSSRVLIFSQMTKVLNILESFLNLHAHRYLRLDGATKTGERQRIVERFNTDSRIFCMILTTRAGGVGLNLTGADTVIFYDTDYNPAIDAQAQDRVHRIGQKKPVHIYRLVSEKTVEENILRRANEKRTLESLVISQAGFNIDSFQNRSALQDLVGVKSVSGAGEKSGHSSAGKPVVPSAGAGRPQAIAGGPSVLQKQSVVRGAQNSGTPPAESQKPRNGSANELSWKQIPILSAHGPVKPLAWVEAEAQAVSEGTGQTANGHMEQPSLKTLAEDSDVYHRLVTQDDGTAGQVNGNNSDTDDFYDPDSSNSGSAGKAHAPAFASIERSLTPIQRFALKFIETGSSVHDPLVAEEGVYPQADDPPDADPGESDQAHDDSSPPSQEQGTDPEAGPSLDQNVPNGGLVKADVAEGMAGLVLRGSDDEDEDEDEVLFYEQQTTNSAYLSSLKALTDTDVNIKLYLPLRDGGPEELKISSVVNGTAAAGLECAEDAAFFPHAYNRMSRTIYATKRQKEKAAANLRKREELEEKRKREAAKTSAALRAGGSSRSGHPAIAPADANRAVGQKFRQDLSNLGKSALPAKKARLEAGNRMKQPSSGASSSGMPGSSGDGSFPGTNGLFRKNIKRNQRRVSSMYGKSSINFTANAMFGETLGKNDGWTVEEDKTVVELVGLYSGNMALVADALAMHPDVVSGNRRRRSIRHITERWFNVIQKESKTGQPGPKTSEPGAVVSNRNLGFYAGAAQKSSSSFHSLDVKSIEISDMHASHGRAAIESQKKAETKFSGFIPPTLTITKDKIVIPRGHIAGFKAHECTPQALNKKKLPFVRAPRSDSRSSAFRGSGGVTPQQPQPPVGSGRGSAQPSGAPGVKAIPARNLSRIQASGTPAGRGQPRLQAVRATVDATKVPFTTARTGAQASTKAAPAPRLQNVGPGPIVPPGTSARMSIGQFGNARGTIGPPRVPSTFNVGSTLAQPVQSGNRRAQVRTPTPNGAALALPGQPTSIRPTPATPNPSAKVGSAVQQQRRLPAANPRKVSTKPEQPVMRGVAAGTKVFQNQVPPAPNKPPLPHVVDPKAKAHVMHVGVPRTLPGGSKIVKMTTAGPLPKPTLGDSAAQNAQKVISPANTKARAPATTHAVVPIGNTARPVHLTGNKAPATIHPVPRTITLVAPASSSSKSGSEALAITGNTSRAPPSDGLKGKPMQGQVARKTQVVTSTGASQVAPTAGVAPPTSSQTAGVDSAGPAKAQVPTPPLPVTKAPVTSTIAVENGLQTTSSVSTPSNILLDKKEEPKASSQ